MPRGVHPVRGRAPAVEQAGGSQHECPGADRRNARATVVRGADGLDQLGRRGRLDVVAGRHDDRVGPRQIVEPVLRIGAQPAPDPHAGRRADGEVVPGVSQARLDSEYRARCGELEQRHAVGDGHGD